MDLDIGEDDEDSESDTLDMDLEDDSSSDTSSTETLHEQVIDFCGGPDLIQIFGPTGSCKTEFVMTLVEEALKQEQTETLFIDTEKNLSDNERIEGIDYVYIPDFDDIYSYVAGKDHRLDNNSFGENSTGSMKLEDGYDIIVMDSIGLPALLKYDEYSIEDDSEQFDVFQMFQYISGIFQRYAARNDALVLITNQPGSELSDDQGESPFGDKSQFTYKELWKTQKVSSSEVKTKCNVNAFRSRQAGEGKTLFKVEVSDSGTEIEFVGDEEVTDEWA